MFDYRAVGRAVTVDVNVGALDEPEACPPRRHIYCADALSWLKLADGLPRYRQGGDSDTIP